MPKFQNSAVCPAASAQSQVEPGFYWDLLSEKARTGLEEYLRLSLQERARKTADWVGRSKR